MYKIKKSQKGFKIYQKNNLSWIADQQTWTEPRVLLEKAGNCFVFSPMRARYPDISVAPVICCCCCCLCLHLMHLDRSHQQTASLAPPQVVEPCHQLMLGLALLLLLTGHHCCTLQAASCANKLWPSLWCKLPPLHHPTTSSDTPTTYTRYKIQDMYNQHHPLH